MLIDLYSEQIAGFYDDETKEMYVIQGESFLGPERLTYAHEYVHALQDQNYDFENGLGYNDENCEADSERCAAISVLIEGDASTLEMEWFTSYGTHEDGQEINDFYATFDSPIFDGSPEFIQSDLIFPYSQGADFVESLLDKGGWEAVDAAYANLPVSTEQILHPERYPDDLPQTVSLPDLSSTLGAGWIEIDQGVLGEWYTFLILAYGHSASFQLSESQARQAAQGWGGDHYVVFYQPETSALALVVQMVWDTSKDATEFGSTFEKYGDKRFGAGQEQPLGRTWADGDLYSEIITQDDLTTWIIAPDAETGAALRQALQLP